MTTTVLQSGRFRWQIREHRARRHGRPRGHRRVYKGRTVTVLNETGRIFDRSRIYTR